MRALVTGGTGKLGSAIVARLEQEGWQVFAAGTKDGDLGEDEPAAQVPLGITEHRKRRRDGHGQRRRANEGDEHIDAERDPVALFDLRRNGDEVLTRRLAAR